MGVGAYVTGGNAVFGGASSNTSKITWTYSNRTLLITLGRQERARHRRDHQLEHARLYAGPDARHRGGGSFLPFTLSTGKKF